MAQVKIAFYKGKGGLDTKLIKWWTKSPYSHVELIKDNIWITSHPDYGMSIGDKIYDPNDWDFIEISYNRTKHMDSVFTNFINNQIGSKYDWKGIFLSQFINLGYNETEKWFCSELVTKLLQILLVEEVMELQPNKVSPGKLFNTLNK